MFTTAFFVGLAAALLALHARKRRDRKAQSTHASWPLV
jgi:hypothetical protein